MTSPVNNNNFGKLAVMVVGLAAGVGAIALAVNRFYRQERPILIEPPSPPAAPVIRAVDGRSQYSFEGGDDACAPIAAGMIDALLSGQIPTTSQDLEDLVVLGVNRYGEILRAIIAGPLGEDGAPLVEGHRYLDIDMCTTSEYSDLRERLARCPCPRDWGGPEVILEEGHEAENYEQLLEPLERLAIHEYRQPLAALMTVKSAFTLAVYFNPITRKYIFIDSHGRGDGVAKLRSFSSRRELGEYLVQQEYGATPADAAHPDRNRCFIQVYRRRLIGE